MKFVGDIIITDPCYIIREPKTRCPSMYDNLILKNLGNVPFNEYTVEQFVEYKKYQAVKEEWEKNNPDEWDLCEYGSKMEALGIKTYLTRSTEYGDWSCSTYNTNTREKIGTFCADAGLVSVFLLDEVLKYNPDFDYHINNNHTTTWIKDFDGDVEIVYDKFRKNGDEEVRVIGTGNINFFSSQTGF